MKFCWRCCDAGASCCGAWSGCAASSRKSGRDWRADCGVFYFGGVWFSCRGAAPDSFSASAQLRFPRVPSWGCVAWILRGAFFRRRWQRPLQTALGFSAGCASPFSSAGSRGICDRVSSEIKTARCFECLRRRSLPGSRRSRLRRSEGESARLPRHYPGR